MSFLFATIEIHKDSKRTESERVVGMTLFRGLFCQVAQEVVRALKKEAGSLKHFFCFRMGMNFLKTPDSNIPYC